MSYVEVIGFTKHTWRSRMPWYWSDDLLQALNKTESSEEHATTLPVAFRRDTGTIEEVAVELAEEGEIPLAA